MVNAKFFFSELVIAFNSSGKHRSLDVLTGKVLGEKPAQSAVNNNQHIATADIPIPSDFSIPCFGSFSEFLESLGHVPQQQCLVLTMFVIWDKFEFVLAQIT